VITQAGGVSGEAANEVILIPSRPGTVPNSSRLASLVNYPSPAGRSGYGIGVSQAASTEFAEPSPADQVAFGQARLGTPSLAAHDEGPFTADGAHEARGPTVPFGPTDHRDFVKQREAPDTDEALELAGSDDAVTIRLKDNNLAGAGKYVEMPMRPGDVLVVPGGGDVMVVGWVHQPGRFQVGSGLTVLGAIGAAGGPMYAAKTKSIVLIRTGKHGGKITIPINMDQITHGQAVDPPVQANDVIDVPYSGLRIGPYIFYSILTRVGISGPVIPY
jgi:SLBB domain-containing protein